MTSNPIYLGSPNSKNMELQVILSSDQAAHLRVTLLQNQNINLKIIMVGGVVEMERLPSA